MLNVQIILSVRNELLTRSAGRHFSINVNDVRERRVYAIEERKEFCEIIAMAEGVDHHELEKMRPFPEEGKDILNPTDPPDDPSSQKWKILLEPALVGAMMAINLGQTSLQNFYLRTACTVDIGFPANVCDRGVGEDFRIAEEESQRVVSSLNISRTSFGFLLSTVVLLFVGPWSDCSGRRKPLLILPLLGMCVMTAAILVLVTFPGFSTTVVLYAVQIPMSLGGNFGLLITAAFSHIGDVCHATGRDVTRTMGTHRASIQVAQVIGALAGPQLYRQLGFYGVFPIVLFLQLMSLLYVILIVKDVNVNRENEVSVFNWRLPFESVKCLMKPREGFRKRIMMLMLIVGLGDRLLYFAEVLLSYMFYRRKFEWDDIMFGYFLAYRNIVSFFGTITILTLLKRSMRLSDEMVGVVSCISYLLSTAALVGAQTTVIVFLIPLIGILSQGSQVVQRPILNKQILPSEQGKIYSIIGALESATQIISAPLYSLLYAKTVATNPDAWLFPGMIICGLQLASYIYSRYLAIETKKLTRNLTKKSKLSNIKLEGLELDTAKPLVKRDIVLNKSLGDDLIANDIKLELGKDVNIAVDSNRDQKEISSENKVNNLEKEEKNINNSI